MSLEIQLQAYTISVFLLYFVFIASFTFQSLFCTPSRKKIITPKRRTHRRCYYIRGVHGKRSGIGWKGRPFKRTQRRHFRLARLLVFITFYFVLLNPITASPVPLAEIQASSSTSFADIQRRSNRARQQKERRAKTRATINTGNKSTTRKRRNSTRSSLPSSKKRNSSNNTNTPEPNFSSITIANPESLSNFEQDPQIAALLWHLNSGTDRFSSIDSLQHLDPNSEEYKRAELNLKQEIRDECLSPQETHDLLEEYYGKIGFASV